MELWLGRGKGAFEKTPLVVPILTFYFFILVFQLTLPIESAYVLLFVVSVLTLIVYDLLSLRRVTRRKELESEGRIPPIVGQRNWRSSLDISNYTVSEAIVPILLGITVVGVPFLLYVFLTGQTLLASSLSPPEFLRDLTTQVFVIAVTEEFTFRFAYAKIYGGVLPQVLFGLSHPVVRDLLLSGQYANAVVPFFYFFLFGLAFQQLVFMGQASDVPEKYRQFFGLPLTQGMHGMVNTLLILFPGLQILGVIVGPFQVFATPSSLLVVALEALAIASTLFYVVARARRRGKARTKEEPLHGEGKVAS